MATEHQHVSARVMVLSPNSQNAYGAALADAALTMRDPLMDGGAFATIGRTYFSNGDMANKGHDYPSVRAVQEQATSLQMQGAVGDKLAGWLIAQLLNAVTTTGAAAPYTHVFKPLSASRQAKVTTLYIEDTAALKAKYMDMAGVELTISGGGNGPVQFSLSLQGSGKILDGAFAAALPAISAPTILMSQDTDILMGPTGAPVSIKEQIRSWQWKISRDIEVFRAPGGGLYAVQLNQDKVRATFSFVIRAKDTETASDPRTLYLNDTVREVQFNTNSGAQAQLKAKFPNCYVRTTPTLDGRFMAWQVEATEEDVLKIGANEIIEVTVINGQATYLVGA